MLRKMEVIKLIRGLRILIYKLCNFSLPKNNIAKTVIRVCLNALMLSFYECYHSVNTQEICKVSGRSPRLHTQRSGRLNVGLVVEVRAPPEG